MSLLEGHANNTIPVSFKPLQLPRLHFHPPMNPSACIVFKEKINNTPISNINFRICNIPHFQEHILMKSAMTKRTIDSEWQLKKKREKEK